MVEPATLARQLMEIPSPTRSEQAVMAFMAETLRALGWHVTRQPVVDGRDNVYAHRGEPVVVFSTHLDTVPPELPISLADGVLRGRGACDAKGIAAAMVAAAERLVAEGETRIGLLFVVGEEDGSEGAKASAALTPRGRYLINGEPTGNRLVTGQKGALRATLRARGVAAHSGYPHLGDSAIDHLLDALARIRALPLPTDPLLGPATLNIGRLLGGEAPNVIAPRAEAQLMWRMVTDSAPLRAAVEAAAGPHCEVTFTLEIPILRAPAVEGWESVTVGYASDLPLMGAWGTGYQLGPGTIHVAHTDHEAITVAELDEGVETYVRLARTLLRETVR